MDTHLAISGVGKTFGTHTVLAGIDLSVEKGEFVTLLGPSGCGKSTLLRIVAGLETPDAGALSIAARDVSRLPPEARNVALMFQSYALLPHMSVLENVRFPLRMQNRYPKPEQIERAAAALDLVQLVDLNDRFPRQLSGGQQQRVALARAIVAEPDVLLLDEPLSNLDAKLREAMQLELKSLHRQLGLTTVLVTHDQTEALALADTVVLMNDGRIVRQGSPRDVYARPDSVFAADFIGGANVLDLVVTRTGGGWQARMPDGTIVALAPDPRLGEGPMKFMLRKEAIRLAPEGGDVGGDAVAIDAIVETQNYLGGSTRLALRAGGLSLIALVETGPDAEAADAAVRIAWNAADLVPLPGDV